MNSVSTRAQGPQALVVYELASETVATPPKAAPDQGSETGSEWW
jgi:hypothetical protein